MNSHKHGPLRRPGGTNRRTSGKRAARYFGAMEQLAGVIQELSLARDFDTVTAIVRSAARELTGADGATLVLRDGNQCFYAEESAISPLWKGQRFPVDSCISGWVMLNRQPAVIDDVYADPRIPVEAYRPTFVRSLAMVPIRLKDPIGAIGNYWARRCRPRPQQVRILQALADTTAVAVENVRAYTELERRVHERTADLKTAIEDLRREIAERKRAEAEIARLSLTDDLTGLYNRRGFFLLAEQQLHLARRTGMPACLLFADVDGLKRVNDSQGHEAGDRLLERTAAVLRESFRDTDVVARLGGDEFVILAVGNGEGTEEIRQRLHARIQRVNGNETPGGGLSLSLGAVPCEPADASLEELVGHADSAMYAEKRTKESARI